MSSAALSTHRRRSAGKVTGLARVLEFKHKSGWASIVGLAFGYAVSASGYRLKQPGNRDRKSLMLNEP
jgi:hypothetical protein